MKPIAETVPYPEVEPGTRAFIVGNGKSLVPDQLDKLHEHGEVSFGVNRIHIIYKQTSWRPTYYLLTDLGGRSECVDDIPLHTKQGYPCYVRRDIVARWVARWLGAIPNEELLEMLNNVNPLDAVNQIQYEERASREPWIDGKYNQGGSVAAAQQLALAWGYTPVYMIGCEGDLKANANNHFSPEYTIDDRTPQQTRIINEAIQTIDEIALREYHHRKAEIFNATVGGSKRGGGKPEAIPLTDFWELFDD